MALHDERFIKWKPTVLYAGWRWPTAVALWGLRKNFLKLLLGSQLNLPDGVAPPQRRLGAFAASWPSIQRRCRGVLQHRDLGELQTLGLCFPLVFIGQAVYISRHLGPTAPGLGRP